MGVKYLKPNEDFSFPADFGFTESAKGRHDARNQKFADDDEYGDGSYVERQAKAKGGRIHRAAGGAIMAPGQAPAAGAAVGAPPPAGANPMGALAHATVTMPAIDMLQGATRMMQTGRQQGARAALTAVAASAAHNRGMPMGADAAPQMAAPEAQAPMQAGPAVAAAKGGHMKASTRNALPSSDFAESGRRYPINDSAHARNALSRVSQNGSADEKATVRKAVHRKFPGIGQK